MENEKVKEFIKAHTVIGICPEVYGGLSIPRDPSEIVNGKFISSKGRDVTLEYMKGANHALELAIKNNVDLCILKSKSPSCGSGIIYDGTFTGNLIDGDGITARLLKEHGFKVITENDL